LNRTVLISAKVLVLKLPCWWWH